MKRLLAVIVAILGVISLPAQRPGVEGLWYGNIGPAIDNFKILFKLESKTGGWAGTVEILSQPGAAIPLSKIANDGEEISFSIGGPQGDVAFKGTLSPDHLTIEGDFGGGWYVTGTHGSMRHMGNAIVTNSEKPESMITAATLNLKSLKGKFETDAFVSPHSDIAALMVFEHQMHMMNLLTRIGWDFRIASFLEDATKTRNEALVLQRRDAAKEFVDYLLFVDEALLTNKVEGTSGFAEKFAARGPADSKGRSLRQLDLEHRLMRYPCSYMIYSEAFDGLPTEAKNAIYQRMWQILSGEEKDKKYARLSSGDRRSIVEILRDTKKDLPEYWRKT